ncbi:MAG: PLP-dependent aspartate aminotransferase family protein [Chloroflexota bacterium]
MSKDFTSIAIHGGRFEDSSAVPIFQGINSLLHQERVEYISAEGGVGGPTVEAFETLMTELEGGNWSIATPSGTAAISHLFFGLLKSGDRVVAHRCIYSFASRLLTQDMATKWGIEIEWVDMRDLNQLDVALRRPAALVYFDPIANPAMHLLDTAAIVEKAKAAGAIVAVDNTLLSPYLLRPLEQGVDIVLHSATKYLAGHGDALAGVLTGRDPGLFEQLARTRTYMGGFLAPMNAFLVMRGIRTLPFRMDRHCANTQAVLAWLQTRPEVTSIRYAGWTAEASQLELAAYGGMLAFTMQETIDLPKMRHALKMCRPWGSLGDIATLMTLPVADELRDIPPSYVRMAIGLESPDDIVADLEQAFSK